jgi:hypothetical protein
VPGISPHPCGDQGLLIAAPWTPRLASLCCRQEEKCHPATRGLTEFTECKAKTPDSKYDLVSYLESGSPEARQLDEPSVQR